MASRPIMPPFPVITNGNMSGNLTSIPTIIQTNSMVSYSISFVGMSIAGSVSVQVSNDYSQNEDGSPNASGTWNTLPLNYNGLQVNSIPLAGTSGNNFIDILETSAYAIRLIYTAQSGTGTLQAIVVGKSR